MARTKRRVPPWTPPVWKEGAPCTIRLGPVQRDGVVQSVDEKGHVVVAVEINGETKVYTRRPLLVEPRSS